MSREHDLNLSVSNLVADDPELQEYAIRQIQVLDRVASRFEIPECPPETHYEWHPDDKETHARLTAKGFICDDDLGRKSNYAHTDGAGVPRIADVRCYSIPRKRYQILLAIEAAENARQADPKRPERDFEAAIRNSGTPGLEAATADAPNVARRIDGNEVKHILNNG